MSSIGLAIKESREIKHITQETVGAMAYCSGKLISAIERGDRNINLSLLKSIASSMDEPRIYMEAANEITDGVFGVPWLDGELVDLHRSSVKEKSIEEFEEAINAIKLTRISDNPKACKQEQRDRVRKSILEVIDVYVAAAHYIAIMCREYDFDIKVLFNEQREKLIEHGYLKNEK
ncbi:helix-turn-helix transcriptional regulator [Clostridium sp. 19966]|uniref:helix-turn-helix domain-containing protein n=1 Tax=Clostridium sp. 19966 TaxID=2768166 RepID=UPI0028DE2F4D|nr:helix-turn-helix transcriptional regulator [Clostridium sp. 19966]MDT8717628.1 helix-turn-helix transcriptional regulator [Clostridium sp. 19966]